MMGTKTSIIFSENIWHQGHWICSCHFKCFLLDFWKEKLALS